MSDSNRPDGPAGDDAFVSFDDGVDAITDILSPEDFLDPDEADESNEAAEDEVEDGDEPDETDEADAEDVAADEESEDDEDEDGPDEFNLDDQMVTMADGQQITVAQLRDHADTRIKDMQRTLTAKTTELSESRKQLETEAQTLSQQRDFLVQWFQSEMPQVPDPSMMEMDPMGYMRDKDAYDRKVQKWQQLQNHFAQEHQKQQAENKKKADEILAQEKEALVSKMPFMRDRQRVQEFYADAVGVGHDYGFTDEEITGATDHRFLVALRDLAAYKKLKAKTPAAKKAVKDKPKLLRGSKRQNQKTSQNVKSRADRLAKTGDFDAGVASLMDIID